MRERKYSLPRHTNLASQASRTGAFFIDLAVWVALTAAFFYGCFRLVFSSKATEINDKLDNYKIESHLFYKDENGYVDFLEPDSSFEEYKDVLSYFYLTYVPEVSEDKDLPVIKADGTKVNKSEYFTVEWFNKSLLKIDTEGQLLFEYVTVDEHEDFTQIAKVKESASQSDVNAFMQDALIYAMNKDFNNLPSINEVINDLNFVNQTALVLSLIPAGIITYIVLPIFLKDGATLGKKLFGLGLATSDGYKYKPQQLLMRFMPSLVMLLALFIPIWSDIFILMLVYLTVFLVSFTLAMASPKRSSLHDFCARTIVINKNTSILFDSMFEEEKYIANEDGIELTPDENGEEPEISYER